MEIRTHQSIDRTLCGTPDTLGEGTATVRLTPSPSMAADDHQLVHGGFVFGLADHAAMLAINEPTVVLGAAQLRFTAPVRVGQALVAHATVAERKGKKIEVEIEVATEDDQTVVLTGQLTCFVPPRHVLAPRDDTKKDDSP